jgi:hypothetical protein
MQGTTLGSTIDDIPLCYSEQSESLRGVWYKVIGTGDYATIKLCDDGIYFFIKAITILEGSCDSLSCIHYNEFYDVCEFNNFSWMTEAGKDYYLFVSSGFSPSRSPYDLCPSLTFPFFDCRFMGCTTLLAISVSNPQYPRPPQLHRPLLRPRLLIPPRTMTAATVLPWNLNSILGYR